MTDPDARGDRTDAPAVDGPLVDDVVPDDATDDGPIIGGSGDDSGDDSTGGSGDDSTDDSTDDSGDDATDEEDRTSDRIRSLVEWVVVIGGALVVALLIKTFLFQAFYIPSESMEPTLDVGDRVIVNKLSYDLHDVNRGDLVVFEKPETEGGTGIKDLIKRVIGLPGETVTVRDNTVYIDDVPLDEPYLPEGTVTTNYEGEPIPEGHVFVMGDNRGDSRDSRFFGAVPEDDIVGRAFFRVWPPGDIGFL